MATPARVEVGEVGAHEVPTQLKHLPSRKCKKYTEAQLASKKPRVEVTLNQKCDIINEAKKHGFQLNKIRSIAKVYNVTNKTINRILWSSAKLTEQLLNYLLVN